MPSRVCIVSFRDYNDIEHAVEVSAETLYEAAVLGLKAFRESRFAGDVGPEPATRLTVTLKTQESHQVKVQQVEDWLNCMGKSPREQALKTRLLETRVTQLGS